MRGCRQHQEPLRGGTARDAAGGRLARRGPEPRGVRRPRDLRDPRGRVASAAPMSPLSVDLGAGVTLRRYEMRDLKALWQAIEDERERIAVWMPFVEGVRTIDDERAWLETVTTGQAGVEGGGLWSGSEFLGGGGLMLGPVGIAGEIGHWIRAEHEGRGHNTRAGPAPIDNRVAELRLPPHQNGAAVGMSHHTLAHEHLFRDRGQRHVV